jgi:hypothetical protein
MEARFARARRPLDAANRQKREIAGSFPIRLRHFPEHGRVLDARSAALDTRSGSVPWWNPDGEWRLPGQNHSKLAGLDCHGATAKVLEQAAAR